jgi:broad specificity phosphatase PhoE
MDFSNRANPLANSVMMMNREGKSVVVVTHAILPELACQSVSE